jgi:energy-converting hydrogenase Eha subunit B
MNLYSDTIVFLINVFTLLKCLIKNIACWLNYIIVSIFLSNNKLKRLSLEYSILLRIIILNMKKRKCQSIATIYIMINVIYMNIHRKCIYKNLIIYIHI